MAAAAPSPFRDTDELLSALRGLIHTWCDRRSLRALSTVLPAYLGLYGLTDGWADLDGALRTLQAFGRDTLPEKELELINDLIGATEKLVHR